MTYTVTNPAKPTIVKDPDANLDYGWDFTDQLDEGDTIVSAVYTPQDGSDLLVGTTTIEGAVCKAFISGGNVDDTWSVACRYTTAAGRTDERSLYFSVKQR